MLIPIPVGTQHYAILKTESNIISIEITTKFTEKYDWNNWPRHKSAIGNEVVHLPWVQQILELANQSVTNTHQLYALHAMQQDKAPYTSQLGQLTFLWGH